MFGYQVATFLEELIKRTEDRPIVAHFHEWYVLLTTQTISIFYGHRGILKSQLNMILILKYDLFYRLAGVGLIVSKRRNLPVATLFTTHATLLGR